MQTETSNTLTYKTNYSDYIFCDVSDGYKLRISKDLVEMGEILHRISSLTKTMRPVLDVYMENEKEVKRRLEI